MKQACTGGEDGGEGKGQCVSTGGQGRSKQKGQGEGKSMGKYERERGQIVEHWRMANPGGLKQKPR